MPHKNLNDYLRETFGEKVYKISLAISGITCPNRDGSISTGGCAFCLNGSGDYAQNIKLGDSSENIKKAVFDAIEKGKAQTEKKAPDCKKFIAYFQSFTNTYADTQKLKIIFNSAILHENIVAISIGTRPDCLSDEKLALLDELNKIKPVFVELGLQTANDNTAHFLNRGYDTEIYISAVKKLKKLDINVVTHIIIGLPGETYSDFEESVQCAVKAGTDGIKLQALNILKGTLLGELYQKNELPEFKELQFDEYINIISRLVKLLPNNIVIHRLTGDGPRDALIAPLWCLDKKKVLNATRRLI